MTQIFSRSQASDLQAVVREWVSNNVKVNLFEEAEQVAQVVGKLAGEAAIEASTRQIDEKATYEGATIPCQCGAKARFKGYRRRWVVTLHGEVEVKRAYYYCDSCARGWLPWDAAQGLNASQWSPRFKALAAELCARLHYQEASQLLEQLQGIRIEESSLMDIVAEVGGRLRAADAEEIRGHFEYGEQVVSGAAPQRLYVSMDATKAHTDGQWHDIKTGVVYEAQPCSGQDRAQTASYVAAQEPAEEFGERLYMHAMKRGLWNAREVVVIGDGAEWIWNQAQMHFPKSTGIIDYYHACEHIWDLSRELYGEGSPQGQRWARAHCHILKAKGPVNLLRALRRRKAKTRLQVEAIRLAQHYFNINRQRMNYPAYLARGMMIGSGPVEAACKVVVGQRLKQSGMRWSGVGADAILAIRTATLNREHDRIELLARAA